MINAGIISGKSSRLKRAAVTSSTGAEVYALSAAAHEAVSVRNQLRELQHGVEATSTLRGDNQSSILVATTPGKHRSSLRHLELHAFAIRDLIAEGEVTVCWCPGDDCIADLFTKSVDAPKFRKFTRFILGEATQEHKTALVSRAYCTYRGSDITQAQQGRLPWEGVCGRGGKANGHVSAPRGKGPASAELTSEQQALS